ncbi:MAG: hypothetical protein R3E83_11215 [Burkholderiaceae bacterium]
MTADRHHVHHLLLALGASANGAVRILHGISLAFGAIGIGGAWLGVLQYLLFWALVLSFGACLMFSIEFWRRHEARQSEAASRPAAPSAVGQSPVRVFE